MNQEIQFQPVLLGSDINVYGMARSFHQEYGVTSVAIGKGILGPCTASKIVTVEVVEPNLEDDAVFVKTLLDFAKRYEGSGKKLLLVPCGDNYIKLLVRNQEKLRGAYVFECISEELLMRLSIKESFYQVCTEHGFAFPKTTTCSYENYKTVELPFDFPVIIKPSNSVAYWNCRFPHKKKVFVAQNKQEYDAILEAILQEMALIDPDMPATVLSKEPKSTRLAYRVRSVSRTNMFAWHSAMRHAKLYINGGGSLIQDVTSRRSLWFYLLNIAVAKRCGCKVQMYGCGIGPVTRENHRRLAARVLNRYVDVITLREPDSREELRAMGVTKPEILLTADPALTLRKAEDDQIDSVLLRAGIPPQGRYLCFALRQWRGFEEKAPLFGAAARYAYKTYGLIPVFTAVEKHLDPAAARLAAQGLDIPHYFLDDAGGAGTIIGALSRMEAVVSMRLHALIFAAGQGIPLAGVVYDPKVSAFLRYTGQDNFTNLEDLTEAALRAMIDRAVGQAGHPETQAAAVERLQAMEGGNVAVARRLLKL